MNTYYFIENIGLGEVLLGIDSNGIVKELWLGKAIQVHKYKLLDGRLNKENFTNQIYQAKEKVLSQLIAYEKRQIKKFDLNFEPEGTLFQKEVWKMLSAIPYGSTLTYGELANQIAIKRGLVRFSAQAVGQAIGKNPLSIIIPCHRVIGKKGEMVGYSGGIEIKRALLELEKHDR